MPAPAPAPPAASFASVDEAMDLVRAGLGYIAQADAASLPAVTQARLLREYERAQSQHTAGRARVLTAFTVQGAYADDGHGGSHPWLAWQTQVTAKAASGSIGWMRRLSAHPVVAGALAAGQVSESYARKICGWTDLLPYAYRDSADEFLAEKAAGGLDLDGLAQLAEQIYSQLAPPDRDQDDDARFKDRFFRLTRLFQGHGKADGDLTPECLAAVTEVLDTLGKKAGPEDDRSAGQRRHDALEEAMRLLLASGCLPDRAGQAAQVQLHLTLDELMDMPGASDAASAWLARHLGDAQPGDGGGDASLSDASAGHPDTSQPGGTNQPCSDDTGPAGPHPDHPGASQPGAGSQPADGHSSARPDLDELIGPDPRDPFARPRPRAARRAAARAGQPGWLTGKAAAAYSCDAKIAPMVCGHLDRNLLARAVTDLLAGDLANLVTSTDPVPAPGPRCECDEHPPAPRAAIPGALPTTTAAPGQPPAATPVAPGVTAAPAATTAPSAAALTPGGLARLQDTLLRYAVSLLSGPAGLAAYLRTQLTGGFFPAPSLPLDLGQPTEQVPPHLRRAVITRDRHCSFPGCTAPPVRCHVHHVIPRSQGGATSLDNLTLLCAFHHLIAVHRWGWTLQLHADGTTTATSPEGLKTLHSHSPPPGQDSLWAESPGGNRPIAAA
jgi:Domain of unknown function (DUF222)/HNH endonuclease